MALSVDLIEFTTTGGPRQSGKMTTPEMEASDDVFEIAGRVEGLRGARWWRCPLH
jgi:hypothetical protein